MARFWVFLMLVSVAGSAWPAWGNEKVRVVYTSSIQFVPGFVAVDKGFFAARGLDVSYTISTVTSAIPATLVSESADIGGTTISNVVQAVDGGLDLLVIAGSGQSYPGATNLEAISRIGSGIVGAQDYIGKRVGMPGIGSVLDILFRNWLMVNKVDPGRVVIVEVSSPQLLDVLRSGSVDAVVANEPQRSRLITAGVGQEGGRIMDALPGPLPSVVYAVTGDYARAHRATVLAFLAGLGEGVAYVDAHPDEARATMAKWLHFQPDVVKDLEMPHFQTEISATQVGYIIDMLDRQQKMQQKLAASDLVFK